MNNRRLDDLLRHAAPPSRPDDYWNDFPGAVTRALKRGRRDDHALQQARRLKVALRWSMAFAMACLLIGVALGWNHRRVISERQDLAEARKLVSELSALFPGQLQAIVMDNGQSQVLLSETPMAGKGLPIFLRVCDEGGCERIITFSGQQVQVNGRPCDVLLDARGHVIVAGSHFVWSSESKQSRAGGVRITGRALEGVL
jgi:hypothetical protein